MKEFAFKEFLIVIAVFAGVSAKQGTATLPWPNKAATKATIERMQ